MRAGHEGNRGRAGHAPGVDWAAGSEVSEIGNGFRAEHHPTLFTDHATEMGPLVRKTLAVSTTSNHSREDGVRKAA